MKHEKSGIKFFRYTGSSREGINARPTFIPLHEGLTTLQAYLRITLDRYIFKSLNLFLTSNILRLFY